MLALERVCVFVPKRKMKTVHLKGEVFEMCVRECLRTVCVKMKQNWFYVRCVCVYA